MDAVSDYKARRQSRLGAKAVERYRLRRDARLSGRMDDDEEENGGGSKRHGNTKIPFGLCQREGIKVEPGWGPKDAWDALAGKGYSAGEVYKELKETGKVAKKSAPTVKFGKEHAETIKARKGKKKELDDIQKEDQMEQALKWRIERENRSAYGARSVAQRELENAEKRRDFVAGRSLEQLEKEYAEYQQEYDLYSKMNDRLYNRPMRGTPEREKWDEWVNSLGGWEAAREMCSKQLESDDGVWKKRFHTERAIKYFKQFGADGGYAAASEALRAANEKCAEADKKIEEINNKRKELAERQSRITVEMARDHKAWCDAVKLKFPTYNDCKTAKDVADRMEAENYFAVRDVTDHDTGEIVGSVGKAPRLGRISVEAARKIATDVDSFFNKVPQMKGKLEPIWVHGLRTHKRYGQSSKEDGVELNEHWYRDADALARFKKSYQEDVDDGFHPRGTAYHSVIYHEYTHQLDDYMKAKLDLHGVNFSDLVMGECCKKLGYTPRECKDDVSRYARKEYPHGKYKEFLAEAYSMYLTSDRPSATAQIVGEVVDDYLRKLGD